jgi:hypothetical protein
VAEADVVEHHRLAGPVPGGPEQLEGPGGVAVRIGEPLVPFGDPGQALVNPGLADVIADHLELGERALEIRDGVIELPGPREPDGQGVAGVGGARGIAGLAGRGQAGLLGAGVVGPGPAPDEERAQGPRELPGGPVQAGFRRQPHGAQQRGVLGREPGHGAVGRARLGGHGAGRGGAQRERVQVRLDQPGVRAYAAEQAEACDGPMADGSARMARR